MMMKHKIKAALGSTKSLYYRFQEVWEILSDRKKKGLDKYSEKVPHPQNIVDLFEGGWASKFPEPLGHLKAGNIDLFNDSRIEWGIKLIGGVNGKKVLELGPLEGGHSYLLQKHGASVISIEANPRAFLKCLAVKEILNLNQVQFLFGDFTKYLKEEIPAFDLCMACGVLYHMRNPVELIAEIAKASSKAYIWTHYYDPKVCREHPHLSTNFKERHSNEYGGYKHTLYKHEYGVTRGKKFYGGPANYSCWMAREEILNACKHFGFKHLKISEAHDTPDYGNGPAFAFLASKDPL